VEAVSKTRTVDPVETRTLAADSDRPRLETTDRDGFDRALGLALVGASLALALVVQTALFERWSWTLGDLIYHRGVAYTVAGGDWEGGGPFRGLLSYSGGLYPMLLGGGARLLDVDFDKLVTVASWLASLAWPLAALLLARRVWRDDWLSAGVFVVLVTAAAPLTTSTDDLWAESALPSGHNFAPVYPRDVAFTLLLVALWAALSSRRLVRVLGGGSILAVTTLFQPQIGVLGALVVVAWWVWSATPARRWRQGALDGLATIGIVVVMTSWWWIPRAVTIIRSHGLAVPVHPGRPLVGMGPRDFVVGFGVAGLVGLVGVFFAWRRRFEPMGLFLVWLVLMVVPLSVLALARDSGLVTSRRAWLLASVPILGLAVPVIVAAARATPRALAPVVVTAVLLPSAPALAATFHEVRTLPWRQGIWPSGEDLSTWTGPWNDLRQRVQHDGDVLVLTYDSKGAPMWSFSGARIYSAFLPIVIKPAFDLGRLTGVGYRERVRRLDAAFGSGQRGLCRLGRSAGADAFALDAKDGLVGVYDRTPAAQYRTDPRDRTVASIDRAVAPGVRYRDDYVWGDDYLRVAAGGRVSVPWQGSDVRLLNVKTRGSLHAGPALEVRAGGDAVTLDAGHSTVALPAGAPDGLEITALQPVDLREVTGYAAVPGLSGANGPFVVSRDGLCRGD
jgi:hypothetical protein